MRKKELLSGLLILVIGLLEVALILAIYVGLYLGLETLFFQGNPQGFPAGRLRMSMAIVLYLLYLVLTHTKLSDFWKAALSVGPNGIAIIAIVLAFYENVWLFLAFSMLFVLLSLIFMVKNKVVWYYYFALACGVCLGLLYAWPQ